MKPQPTTAKSRPARSHHDRRGDRIGTCLAPATAPGIRIDHRFLGPPGMGNGGYAAGSFAGLVKGPAEVKLSRPVPLGRALRVLDRDPEGALAIGDDRGSVASVRSTEPLVEIEPPLRPTIERARACAVSSPYLTDAHPFPGCFVCGPDHPDGLGIHPGPLAEAGRICAGLLEPRPSLTSAGGELAAELVWAALDCPSFTAARLRAGRPHLLGRLSAELLAPVPATEPSVVVGWELGSEGRKLHSAAALLGPDGELLARSRALWIAIRA